MDKKTEKKNQNRETDNIPAQEKTTDKLLVCKECNKVVKSGVCQQCNKITESN